MPDPHYSIIIHTTDYLLQILRYVGNGQSEALFAYFGYFWTPL